MVGFGIVLALAGVIVLIAGAAQAGQNRAFRGAQPVTGTVLHMHSPQRKNGRAYLLKLSYTVDGVAYERELGVARTEYEAIQIGGQYRVLYRPDRPQSILRPQDAEPKNGKPVLIVGAALVAAGIGLFFLGRL